MPCLKLNCVVSAKEVDVNGAKFVVCTEKSGNTPREIAHLECYQKRPQAQVLTPFKTK
jgi:hypothetical protein